ncbi:MAG: hypothetical protein HOO06_11755 [Bdellovibrionaceae bacterium]|jgi:hypothetical protein|nr:hypothetical protein [Pseudobdellovibrionaceae bacterium]
MEDFFPIQDLPEMSSYGAKDSLVIFGEVFENGYINGLITEAKKLNMKVIYATVGRRDENNQLRPLTPQEISDKAQSPLINVPLEAGFDLEKNKNTNMSMVDYISEAKLKTWSEAKFPWDIIEENKQQGRQRFLGQVKQYFIKLNDLLPKEGNILFAHTMAGGIPRQKLVLSLMNKILKGTGDRYNSSEIFSQSELGKLCLDSFNEVTGETLKVLINESATLRDELAQQNRSINYIAYGYHGTEINIGSKYTWYSYTPYLQGHAKIYLENIAKEAQAKDNVHCTVYNVPEILTNSSGIFQGIELAMYPLLESLYKKRDESNDLKNLFKELQSKLKEGVKIEDTFAIANDYFSLKDIMQPLIFKNWPQENNKVQMGIMKEYSQKIVSLHESPKEIIIAPISEVILRACGKIILHSSQNNSHHMQWIGHQVILKSELKDIGES